MSTPSKRISNWLHAILTSCVLPFGTSLLLSSSFTLGMYSTGDLALLKTREQHNQEQSFNITADEC